MDTRVQSQVVIVGAGGAGDGAEFALRKNGFEGRIALIGADHHRPYERPYLSKQYLRDEIPAERVFLHPSEEYERQRIELLPGRRVVEASHRDKAIVLDDDRRLHFDILILATGGIPRWLPDVPRLSNVFTLRTLDDSTAIKQALTESRRMLLLGAGFIGAEVAASARMKGKEVLVVEVAPVPLGRALGQEMGEIYARIHRSLRRRLRVDPGVLSDLTSDLRELARARA
jgi:3-phenylpropionate/trans-cinnamate dioxygenase ferredoxin reductase component